MIITVQEIRLSLSRRAMPSVFPCVLSFQIISIADLSHFFSVLISHDAESALDAAATLVSLCSSRPSIQSAFPLVLCLLFSWVSSILLCRVDTETWNIPKKSLSLFCFPTMLTPWQSHLSHKFM